jgi:primosomal protein N'
MLAINCFTSPDLRKGFKGSIQLPAPSVSMSNSSKNGTLPQTAVTIGEAAMTVRGLLLGVEEMKVKSKQKETMVGSSVLPESYVNSERLIAMKSPPSRISGKLLGAQKGMVRALLQAMKEDLNVSQKVAIESAMCQRTTLWQGPPGTGKTRTLVHFIASFCRSGQGQVLACADR